MQSLNGPQRSLTSMMYSSRCEQTCFVLVWVLKYQDKSLQIGRQNPERNGDQTINLVLVLPVVCQRYSTCFSYSLPVLELTDCTASHFLILRLQIAKPVISQSTKSFNGQSLRLI